jgi:hypothetical protein
MPKPKSQYASNLDELQQSVSMQRLQTKHIFLSYEQPGRIITTLIILVALLIALYIYLGEMTFMLWVLAAAVVIAFVQALRKRLHRGPCVIINEEGINDKRLRLGVIRWSDIKRVRMQGLGGAYFISLELFDSKQYLSRQPASVRIANKLWRLYNMSPIHIKVAYMDVAPEELFEIIMSEIELNRSGS